MDDLERRVHEVKPHLAEPAWSALNEQALRTAVERRLSRRRGMVIPLWAGALASAAILVLWLVTSGTGESRPLVAGAATSSAAPALGSVASSPNRSVTFADGSRATAVSADMQVETIRQESGHVEARLASGSARFEVVPNPSREFVVDVGQVKVAVLGTVFTLAHEGPRVHVAVMVGKVRVDWAGGSTTLLQDSEGVFPPASDGDAALRQAELGTAPTAPPSERADAEKRRWVELARAGDVRAAYSRLMEAGPGAVADVPEELLLAADVSRRAGHVEQAAKHLERLLLRYPRDERASVAAFTLGRIRLQLGRPGPAAAAFEQVANGGGALAEDALYRAVLALRQAGNAAKADGLRQRYFASYPGGRYAEALQKTP